MADEPLHPITTPKAASAVSVLLGVIGVFAPFITNIFSAQLFAAVAVLVIAWLYAAETGEVLRGLAKPSRLIIPIFSILIILIVAVVSTLAVDDKAKPEPAVTLADLNNAMASMASNKETPKPEPAPSPIDRSVTYKVVVPDLPQAQTPKPAPAPAPAKSGDSEDVFKTTLVRMKRNKIGWDVELKCMNEVGEITAPIRSLISKAVEYQNEYYYGKNDKNITSHFNSWEKSVKDFIAANRDGLPDTSSFDLANEGKISGSFLGIHNEGTRLWFRMDAKRKALESIAKQASSRSCSMEGKAAIADCTDKGSC